MQWMQNHRHDDVTDDDTNKKALTDSSSSNVTVRSISSYLLGIVDKLGELGPQLVVVLGISFYPS